MCFLSYIIIQAQKNFSRSPQMDFVVLLLVLDTSYSCRLCLWGVCKGCTSRIVFFSNIVWKVWSPTKKKKKKKKSSLRSFFTCTNFDFWRCKIKLSCKCAPSLPFMLLQYHGVKKQRRQRLREIWSVLPLNIPHSQTTASHCHYKYIRNQLFMEQSQGLFNLFLLSN